MGTVFRYLADPSQESEVLAWFKALPAPPLEAVARNGIALHFKESGPIASATDGTVHFKASPVASVVVPRVTRGVLWTVGEVHFLPSPMRQFPEVQKVSAAFSRWLATFSCVYSRQAREGPFAYYLEGSVRNFDAPIYAFTSGLLALQSGRYFVADGDGEPKLQQLCNALRLRGVECLGPNNSLKRTADVGLR